DQLPAGLACVSATPSQGTYDHTTGIWTLGSIPVTLTETLSITARVTAGGGAYNSATRQSSSPVDPNTANDTATASTSPQLVADLAITTAPSVATVAAGAPLTWTVVVTNNGPSDATAVSVSDAFLLITGV